MALIDLSSSNLVTPVTTNLNKVVHNLPIAIVTLIIGVVVIRVLSAVAKWLISFIRMQKGLKEILVSLVDMVLAVTLVIVVLQTLGLDNVAFAVTALVAGLGIAIGNGAIPLMTDTIAGVYLGRDRHFSIGDIVRVGEPGEAKAEGEIISMDMRRTRIKDVDGWIHSLPNTIIERHEYILITKKRDRTDA